MLGDFELLMYSGFLNFLSVQYSRLSEVNLVFQINDKCDLLDNLKFTSMKIDVQFT